MTTWNKSALNILEMFDRGSDLAFDDTTLGVHAKNIAKAVRENNTVAMHDWITAIGFEATRGLASLGLWHPEVMQAVLVKKQNDYGHENILAFGVVGVAIRVCDKIARYENLKDRKDQTQNEPFEDCMMDMVGYATIARMIKNGTFTLELE
jgi:hypothetical protein